MKEKLLSIIVPIYNSEQYLKHCLDTIMNQTYSTFECLMVDDGSTDNSSDICTEYAKKDTRFKYLRKNRGGGTSSKLWLESCEW